MTSLQSIALLLLLAIPIGSWSQRPGRWCGAPLGRGECLDLKADSTFDYTFHDCTKTDQGSGNWHVIGDSLFLHFGPDPDSIRPEVTWEHGDAGLGNGPLKVEVMDESEQGLQYGILIFYSEEGRQLGGLSIDSLGRGSPKDSQWKSFAFVEVHYIGMCVARIGRPSHLDPEKLSSISIKVNTAWLDGHIPEGTIARYKMVEATRNRMVLECNEWTRSGIFIRNASAKKFKRWSQRMESTFHQE